MVTRKLGKKTKIARIAKVAKIAKLKIVMLRFFAYNYTGIAAGTTPCPAAATIAVYGVCPTCSPCEPS